MYRRYCWPVRSLDDLKLAPFHLLATPYHVVDLSDEASERATIGWWEEMTEAGGEGVVVKPLAFVHRGRRDLVQPAVKCRGREYLRITYGPEYTREQHLTDGRHRGLGAKRSLALRESAALTPLEPGGGAIHALTVAAGC